VTEVKILISAQGPDIDALLDPRFGRAAHFVVVDGDSGEWIAYPNPGAASGHGAGIEAARFAVEKGVQAVITGAAGPNAFRTLAAAGVKVYTIDGGTVGAVLDAWRRGDVTEVAEATAPAHAGMGAGGGAAAPAGGMGGGGRGMGGGRGAGGGGGGRGMGGGRGAGGGGGGRGMGGGRGAGGGGGRRG